MSLPAYCTDCGVYLAGGMIERDPERAALCFECGWNTPAKAIVTAEGDPAFWRHYSERSHRMLTCECGWTAEGSWKACRVAQASHLRAVSQHEMRRTG